MKAIVYLCAVILGSTIGTQLAWCNDNASYAAALRPLVTTAELVVGRNRFAFGLIKDNRLVDNAKVTLKQYAIDGARAVLTSETDVPYHNVGLTSASQSVHRHADGTSHVHNNDGAIQGIYITHLNFPRAGDWGIELTVRQNDSTPDEPVRLAVTVHEATATPAVGSPAPRSRNLITRDVKNLREIDTSTKPDPRLHRERIADAIAQRRPQVIIFATPQFCTSRMCGPVVDIGRALLSQYGKQVAFIHQEIWQDFAAKKAFATVDEWRLSTEPWIFVVDGRGIIRERFEGLVTKKELEAALQKVLGRGLNHNRAD